MAQAKPVAKRAGKLRTAYRFDYTKAKPNRFAQRALMATMPSPNSGVANAAQDGTLPHIAASRKLRGRAMREAFSKATGAD